MAGFLFFGVESLLRFQPGGYGAVNRISMTHPGCFSKIDFLVCHVLNQIFTFEKKKRWAEKLTDAHPAIPFLQNFSELS